MGMVARNRAPCFKKYQPPFDFNGVRIKFEFMAPMEKRILKRASGLNPAPA
jgi:hypothetical protein